ncbi:MAG: hypothetical protein KUG51_02475, partial [Urechidicola sp.]|nr:hypothetical protein [Urechidicola sp.]
MANARIEFKIGAIEFVGEGEQEWVTQQLDKILDRVPNLESKIENSIVTTVPQPSAISATIPVVPTTHPTDLFATSNPNRIIPENLSTFLRKKDAVDKQRRRFLGAAVWLQLNGQQTI